MPNLKLLEASNPYAPLKIVALESCQEIGQKINDYIVGFRHESIADISNSPLFSSYRLDNYLTVNKCSRFGTGEAKGAISESVRGKDLYILVDVCNYSLTYTVNGHLNHMSPDDHFQNLKRIIASAAGKAKRINVIMPFLYESRQHKRISRESLDCAVALDELIAMGVTNIITFDAHEIGRASCRERV